MSPQRVTFDAVLAKNDIKKEATQPLQMLPRMSAQTLPQACVQTLSRTSARTDAAKNVNADTPTNLRTDALENVRSDDLGNSGTDDQHRLTNKHIPSQVWAKKMIACKLHNRNKSPYPQMSMLDMRTQ